MKENKDAVTAYIAARPESHQQQLESLPQEEIKAMLKWLYDTYAQ